MTKLVDGMITGQETGLAACEIAKEVLFHHVLAQPDLGRTLRKIHASISSRLDNHPAGAKSAYGLAREAPGP